MTSQTLKTKRRRRIVVGLIVVSIAVALAAPAYLHFYGMPKRFVAVQAGVLYRSAQPTTGQISHLIDEVGLRTLLIVREGTSRRVPNEIDYARSRGVNVIHIPIKSRRPIPDDQVEAFFRCVDDPASRPVLIHCSAGRHRTGYLCALYRIERQGWTVQQALEEMLSFDFDTKSQAQVLEQLKHYTPGRWREAGATAVVPKGSGNATLP